MVYEELTEEQKAKIAACKTPEDILALAQEEGVELSDSQLAEVAGGWGELPAQECPYCHSKNVDVSLGDPHSPMTVRTCRDCGHAW